MKICFPVESNEGIESKVYGHFGSAPCFVVINTDTNDVAAIYNRDMHHAHGACNPLKALDGQSVDAVVTGGIGGGALSRLNESGIKVFQAQTSVIRANLELLKTGGLPEFTMNRCCGGHSGGHGCAHH